MDRLLEILQGIRPDVDFAHEKNLIDGGWIDSFDLAQIISELSDEYNIKIEVKELKPENFNSAESMIEMIARLKK